MANERMINTVSVGIVYVGAPGDYSLSSAEKSHILAEVQEGLEALALNEPRARLSWSYSTLSVNLPSFTPWADANWKGLSEPFYRSMDAALWSGTNNKIYFFRGSEYIRVDPNNGWKADAGYPKPISGNWPGFPATFASSVNAALWSETTKKIYFFKGNQYIRVDPNNGWSVDPGYPKPIAGNWTGFPSDFADGVDSAIWSHKNNRVYFFKGDKYIRVNPVNWTVEAGYPKVIGDNWHGLPDDFKEGIDAAIYAPTNQKVYFFKKNRFYNQYVRLDPNNWTVESGYPKPVGLGWDAEEKWRDPALLQLGFQTGGNGIAELNQFFQNAVGAQFGYVTFFTKMPTAWFAYAGGLRVVMRQTSGLFTSWNSIDSVFSHETGHIFGAPDEYTSSNCKCDSIAGKFIKEVNGNCAPCAPASVSCLMKNNTVNSLCEFTPAHFGWEAFLDKINGGLHTPINNKLYLFSDKYYVRYSANFVLDPDYPKPIEGNWPGMPNSFKDGIDAVIWSQTNQKIYFFKGNQYVRINPSVSWNVEAGYPKTISANWHGLPANFAAGFDAALFAKTNNRIYFFKGTQYVRLNPANWTVEAGYPKPIAGNWTGFPSNFASGVDGAIWADFNQRIYFFKGTRYLRVNPSNNWKVDGGFPQNININWRMPFPVA